MTEQQLTQARADLALLDIEQLRTGVMLQLLKIEALTKERDEYKLLGDAMAAAVEQNTELDARCAKLDAAGMLAIEVLVAKSRTNKSNVTLAQILTAITSPRQAGVQ